MNRLETELRRLYLPVDAGPDGRVRAPVLELAGPAGWTELSRVWKGVQAELEMPAPAIVVDGKGGYQLWFSLVEPIPVRDAVMFLDALRARYLADIAPDRIRIQPSPDTAELPPFQVAPERWSAFVTADLAPLFADEPWLDHPPGVDAQADLLSRIVSAPPESFVRASALLQPADAAPARAHAAPARVHTSAPGEELDPRSFLLQVMRDPSVDLRLRIDAAKALLP